MPKRKQVGAVAEIVHTKLAKTLLLERAKLALEDDAALERQAIALVDQLGDAERGRKMLRKSEVPDEKLLDAYREAKRFPGLKAQEYYRRVGIEVGLSASRVQYHLGRLGKLPKK